jgi:hypothetical protein
MRVDVRTYKSDKEPVIQQKDAGDILVLRHSGGDIWLRATPGKGCEDCCLDSEFGSEGPRDCFYYKFKCYALVGGLPIVYKEISMKEAMEDLI